MPLCDGRSSSSWFQDGEFVPSEAGSLAEAESKLAGANARFDALLLDVSLPDGDGREFCRRLRSQGLKTPIIMLTGSAEEADIVRGLDSGANDYIAKPFRLNELLARLRAQLRSSRELRGCGVFHRAVHLSALGQATGRAGAQQADPPDR